MAEHADVVVVGGGSAGCVLAARLSEDESRTVALVEAGPSYASVEELPDDLRSAHNAVSSHDWDYRSEAVDGRPSIGLPRARVLGGCSSTNAMFAVRGAPSDYDGWGFDGWRWEDVLPFFRKLESDVDFDDEWHGRDGPLPIRRYREAELGKVQRAALESAAALGHPTVADHNAPAAVGAGPAPTNAREGVRISTAMAYLWPAAGRPNLTVRTGAIVDRVTFAGDSATGVLLATGDHISADLVVVAAGAYGSPTMLLRSGIGPAAALRALGIGVVADLPAVGEGLMDHPMIPLVWSCDPDAAGGPIFQTLVSFEPNSGGAPTLQILPGSAEGPAFFISAAVLKSNSRGSVRLRSVDPVAAPIIDIGHLQTSADLDLMRQVVGEVQRMASTPSLATIIQGDELMGIPDPSDSTFAEAARAAVQTYHHVVGTCAMGTDPSTAVVAPNGAVHGVRGLVVADASVMPDIPSANTNVPTIMIAERVASTL